jgi:DNA-binding LacI/PurR family transcriptional regulator
MGEIAAQTLVSQIEGREEYVPEIAIEPEFVNRDSTARLAQAQVLSSRI